VDPQLVDEIERRLRRLRARLDLSRLEGQGATPAAIRSYYERSRLGYRLVHSEQGAMHMALNPDGVFDRAGYEGQARLVAERLPAPTRDVLELACGNGYNLRLLAGSDPSRRLVGIDLVGAQVRRANRALAGLPGARAVVGDFQALPFADASQDAVFVVESLCHATDLALAFAQVARVLRPGGRFVLLCLDEHRQSEVAARYGERHPGVSPRAVRGLLTRAGLDVASTEVASRQVKKPHLQVVLAIADKPQTPASSGTP
jgi:SAM-dependent methyltransferase